MSSFLVLPTSSTPITRKFTTYSVVRRACGRCTRYHHAGAGASTSELSVSITRRERCFSRKLAQHLLFSCVVTSTRSFANRLVSVITTKCSVCLQIKTHLPPTPLHRSRDIRGPVVFASVQTERRQSVPTPYSYRYQHIKRGSQVCDRV